MNIDRKFAKRSGISTGKPLFTYWKIRPTDLNKGVDEGRLAAMDSLSRKSHLR